MQDLLEEIVNDMGKQISKEIDFEILCGMLCEMGWTKVILRPMTHEQGNDIDDWTAQNIKSGMETMGLVWIFEDPKEANWFTLRWL